MLVKNIDSFLTKSFNKNFYNLIIDHLNFDLNILHYEISCLDKNSIFSTNLQENISNFTILEMILLSQNFVKVGSLYTYQLLLDSYNSNLNNEMFNIRFAKLNDLPRLKEIASSSFSDDRFHQDLKIDKFLANSYYSTWIENSIKNYNDYVIVIEEESYIQGFISYKVNLQEYNSVIILNAIDSNFRNKGRYSALLSFLIIKLKEMNIKRLTIGTYENSIGVHKTMKKFGFNILSIKSIYHLHT